MSDDDGDDVVIPQPNEQFEQLAAMTASEFGLCGVDVDEAEVYTLIEESYNQLGLTPKQAADHVQTQLRHRHNITQSLFNGISSGGQIESIENISSGGEVVDVIGRIDRYWVPNRPRVAQIGLVRDNTSGCKFVCMDDDVDQLKKGEVYLFEDVITSMYDGSCEILIKESSSVSEYNGDDFRVRENLKPDGGHDLGDGFDTADDDIPITYTPNGYVDTDELDELNGDIIKISDDGGVVEKCTENGCLNYLDVGECDVHGFQPTNDRFATLECFVTVRNEKKNLTRKVFLNSEMVAAIIGMSYDDLCEIYYDIRSDNPGATPIHQYLTETLCGESVEMLVQPGCNVVSELTLNPSQKSIADMINDNNDDPHDLGSSL